MKVLITGAHGQLGRDLLRALAGEFAYDVAGYGRNGLDIRDFASVESVMEREKPDVVVHAAAYTAVDKAEQEVDEAFLVNATGSRNIAVAAEAVGAKVCYISTDYVFDGSLARPYREFDPVGPATVYGQSKLAGEILTQTLVARYFIVRTSWLYGKHGSNFVKTMLRLGQERDLLQVVHDQVGSPTYTLDLARFLGHLIATQNYGVYHASNSGSCSWYDFATAIFEQTGGNVTVHPCTTEAFPRPAPRPKNSVLDHLAIRTNGFADLPHWRDGLRRFLEEQ